MPNAGHHLCVFWFTATHNAEIGNIKIMRHRVYGLSPDYLHLKKKKKTYQIRMRGLGVHSWPACLSLYLCEKRLLRNSPTLIKIGHWTILFEEESDTVFLSNVWHHPYFHHIMLWVPVIAYSVIRKDFVTRYDSEHNYLCVLSVKLCCCVRICQASSLNATWDKKSLLTEIFLSFQYKM